MTEQQHTMTTDYISLCADHSGRIAALEAQRETEKAAILDIYEKLDRLKTQHESNWTRIVKLEEAAASRQNSLDNSPAPAGGLVSEVAWRVAAFASEAKAGDDATPTARAAILVVSAWIEERHHADPVAAWEAARWLREEVERG